MQVYPNENIFRAIFPGRECFRHKCLLTRRKKSHFRIAQTKTKKKKKDAEIVANVIALLFFRAIKAINL